MPPSPYGDWLGRCLPFLPCKSSKISDKAAWVAYLLNSGDWLGRCCLPTFPSPHFPPVPRQEVRLCDSTMSKPFTHVCNCFFLETNCSVATLTLHFSSSCYRQEKHNTYSPNRSRNCCRTYSACRQGRHSSIRGILIPQHCRESALYTLHPAPIKGVLSTQVL